MTRKQIIINDTTKQALMNGATAFVEKINQRATADLILKNMKDTVIKSLKYKIDDIVYFENEDNFEIGYYISVSNLWQKTTKEMCDDHWYEKVKINMDFFEESWELLHNKDIGLSDRIKEIEEELNIPKEITKYKITSIKIVRVRDLTISQILNIDNHYVKTNLGFNIFCKDRDIDQDKNDYITYYELEHIKEK